jgi:YrbI family 3-deoxy-D-manno-octulosonate 8-phosphate phosphatase
MITDVDGVLTDGGMYYSEKGESFKKFNTRDAMGMELLRKLNIPTIFVTRENSKIVKERAKKIHVELYMNIKDKRALLPKISKKFKIESKNIAYIGDDVNDLEIMKQVGLTAAPIDAMNEIKIISDYVCILKGGEGSFREFANLIIDAHHN